MRLRSLVIVSTLMLLAATQLLAATATDVVPRTAPRGARVVFLGSGFDTALPEVTFAAANGRVAAPLISRSSNFLEVAVPQAAMTGEVKVTAGGAPLATFAFTVAPAPPFVKSATLVRDVLKQPSGAFVALPAGAVYVADTLHHQMKVIAPNGQVQVVVGTGNPGFIDGPASIARFNAPRALAIDRARNVVYVADTGNHAIRAVTATGVMTFAGSGRPEDRDGTGQQAGFKQPSGLAIDGDGNLYVADTGNEKIRKVTPAGVVTTVAGLGRPGLANGGTADALFNQPSGIVVADNAALYVADTGNHIIRKIENGVVSTLAGTGHPGNIDGPSNNAEFKEPAALTLDESGDLLIADSGNHQMRRISNGVVSTVAGTGNPGLIDGTNLAGVQYKQPSGIASEGAVFIADTMNDALRALYRAVSVTDVYPRSGDPSGGDVVRIFGTGFVPGQTTVTFGGTSALTTYVSSTELLATTPAGTLGMATIAATTPAGTATLRDAFNYVPPFIAVKVTPAQATLAPGQTLQLAASGVLGGGEATDLTARAAWSSSDTATATVDSTGLVHAIHPGTAIVAATFANIVGTAAVIVRDPNAPPPDPSTIAPALNPTESTSTYEATSFLYSGPNAIQHGVTPGAIEQLHVAILRGRVLNAGGQPLAGVRISVPDKSEFGWTGSRVDGWFDLAVNGGGTVTIRFEKDGFLPAERQVRAAWQGYAIVDDVALIAIDPAVTTISVNAAEAQVARGSVVTDEDGARQATIVFAAGTTATMLMNDGTSVPLSSLHVRATEYTVGDNGPKAMPASLPPSSGYTYCVELSADEAVTAGARTVQFSKPVSYYVENFIGFPVGSKVPSAYYDDSRRAWIPTPDGRVVRIMAIDNGAARVDTDGDNVADDASIDLEERQKLASLYSAGTTLWRVSLSHFTPWDFNWAIAITGGGVAPTQPPVTFGPQPNCCEISGSVIEAENQTLGEVIPLDGTPFALHYSSDRVPGRTASRTMDIRVTEPSMPASAVRADVEISVGGRVTRQTFSAAPNQKLRYVWDGLDAYGRTVTSGVPVRVDITYVYSAEYLLPPQQVGSSFGFMGGIKLGIPARDTFEITRTWEGTFPATWNATSERLGGWTMTPHHFYDLASRTLYRGDGTRKTDLSPLFGMPQGVVRTLAGRAGVSDFTWNGAGGPAKDATIDTVNAMAVAPDGTLFVASSAFIHKITRDGQLVRIAGTLSSSVPYEPLKTQPALGSRVAPHGLAVGPDGSLYLTEGAFAQCPSCMGPGYVRRITPEGIIEPVAGASETGPYVDGLPASAARLRGPQGVAVGNDGSVYLADSGYFRILKIGPDGIVRSIAGNGTSVFGGSGDGGPATSAGLSRPTALAVGPDGGIYFFDPQRVRKISPDGQISTVAGAGTCRQFGATGDGGAAIRATMCATDVATVLAVGPDGSMYIATQDGIRRVDPAGVINTVTGTGPKATTMSPDGSIAAATDVTISIAALTLGPDGTLYYSDASSVIRAITSSMPSFGDSPSNLSIVDDGLIQVFDSKGKHLKTVVAETGGELYRFGYNTDGLLMTVTDIDGNMTAIERNGAGDATAVVAPGGQRVEISGTPYATSMTTAPAETTLFHYRPDGLMTELIDPRQNSTIFNWNELGLLILDADAEGGSKSLTRSDTATGYRVTVGTAEGRVDRYQTDKTSTEDTSRTVVGGMGLTMTSLERRNASTTTTMPSGETLTIRNSPDPVFAALASVPSLYVSQATMTGPAGTLTTTASRSAVFGDAADPLGSFVRTDTFTTKGSVYTRWYDRRSLTEIWTTPENRRMTRVFDAAGRTRTLTLGTDTPVQYAYDTRGRIATITQGARQQSVGYNNRNEITSITDTLGRVTRFEFDAAGRVQKQILPDLRQIIFGYDANGNLTSITPPSRAASTFDYTKVNLTNHSVPSSDAGRRTHYVYDRDRYLTSLERPDGTTISLNYDSGGRVSSISSPGRTLTYGYLSTDALGSITEPSGSLAYAYAGSLLSRVTWTGEVSGAVSWTYDADFNVSTESVGDQSIAFGYDKDGLLKSAAGLGLSYDPSGLVSATSIGVSSDQLLIDGYGELKEYTVFASGALSLNLHYDRDNAGRITGITEHTPSGDTSAGYVYDAGGRLQDVAYPDVTIHYEYDANGNRVARQVIGATTTTTQTASYDTQDRLVNYEGTQYTYTPNGELRTKTDLAGTTTYTYDSFGNLRHVELPGGVVVDYLVDGQNRRVGKKIDGVLAAGWLYGDQLRVVAELDGSGRVISRFVYGSRTNTPDLMIRDGVTYRIFSDHLGSPRLVVNAATGAVAASMRYDEFGSIISDTNPGFIPFGYAGGLYDRQTGLTRFGARDYDAGIGRWLANDPLGFAAGDANLYTYVSNDPINATDASGLSGTITIYSSDNHGSSAPVWDGHAWIVYTPDGGTPTSYGTYGPMVQAPRGLNTNWELDHWKQYADRTGNYDVISRSMWIDDAHERALMELIARYRGRGEKAWTSSAPCTTFAKEAWGAATGEKLIDKKKGDSWPNPARLGESIRSLNRGLGARNVRKKSQ